MPRQQQDQIDPDIATLLALAQLSNTVQTPDIERQRVQQEGQRTNIDAVLKLLGLQQSGKEAETTAAETERYHTGELSHLKESLASQEQTRREASKASFQEQLVQSLAPLTATGAVTMGTLANAVRKGGNSQLADALDETHSTEVNKKVMTHAAIIGSLKNNPDALKTYLPTVQADPEVWAQLKPHLDEMTKQTQQQSTNEPSLSDYLISAVTPF